MRQAWLQHVFCRGSLVILLAVVFAVFPGGAVTAQEAAPAAAEQQSPDSFWQIIHAGGVIGYLIILLSLAAVARGVEFLIALRRKVLIPERLADEVRALLERGQVARADEQCKLQPSMLSQVLRAGLQELDGGWPAIEKAMEDALAEQSARWYRKVEFLSVAGNIAPMLGLLGTVVGMVLAFREVAATSGTARATELAQGIYLALVTTVMGLVVAIPALAAFSMFRNRVDQLAAETANVAQYALGPVKRRRRATTGGGPPSLPETSTGSSTGGISSPGSREVP